VTNPVAALQVAGAVRHDDRAKCGRCVRSDDAVGGFLALALLGGGVLGLRKRTNASAK
jgi:hypothetical protein